MALNEKQILQKVNSRFVVSIFIKDFYASLPLVQANVNEIIPRLCTKKTPKKGRCTSEMLPNREK